MTTRQSSSSRPQNPLPFIAQIILLIILFFVAIGDAIRLIMSFLLSVVPSSLGYIWPRVKRGTASIRAFIQEKQTRFSFGHKKVYRPKRVDALKPIPTLLWHETLLARTFQVLQRKVITFHIPKLSMPTFKFPRISLPSLPRVRLRIPSLKLPTITFPRITIPRPKIVFPSLKRTVSTVKFSLPSRKKSPPRSKPIRSASRLHLKSLVTGIAITLLFIFIPYNAYIFLKTLPNPQLLTQRDLEVSTKILDRNGQLLYEIYTDQNRSPVKLENIPVYVKEATIAIEDKDFYHHPGFSVRGIIRAATQIVVHKQIQGGSTITQQLIKSALLTPDVNVVRKVKEIILAFWAEHLYTKDQILEMYLNQVPYGGTAWGIEAAAQTYFHKSVTTLTLAEAALLAGLPAAPSEYSPFGNHPELAIKRQHEVLTRMTDDGDITVEEKARAINEPIQFAQDRVGIRAPHFVMYVKELLEQKYGPRLVERGGLRVITSLDINIQEKMQEIVKSNVDKLASLQVGNGAAIVTNPKTGEILAMIGSRNYFDDSHDGNVNVVTAHRQPGSSIKVITYATALENGMTAATLIADAPIVYQQAGSPPYIPVNYDGKFHGPTPMRYALANSYNIPAVKTLAAVGLPAMMEKASLMGIDSWKDPSQYGLSLTLGGGDVTMLEMAKVYGTLANLGTRVDLSPILKVTDYTGAVLETNVTPKPVEAVRPDVSWIISDILADNQARSNAFGPNSSLVIPGKTVSVKTGTTNDKRDNWTAGYTPSLVAVVWVGNNDNSPMNPYLTSGITGAAPIWHDMMVELLKNRPDEAEPRPANIVSIPCYFNRVEYFISGTEPAGGRCAPIPTITPTPTP